MDITQLYTKDNADHGGWITLKDPDGKDTDLKFLVAGAHSEKFRRAIAAAQAEQMNRERNRGKRDVTPDDVELEIDLMSEVLAKCTLDWNAEHDGKAWPCTYDNAKSVYENAPDVRRQAFAFMSDTRNYFSSTSSADSSGKG